VYSHFYLERVRWQDL